MNNEEMMGERQVSENTTEELTAKEAPTAKIGEVTETEEPDYAKLLESDMAELTEQLSSDGPIKITDLKDPLRYGALRDLGLSPKEAYLASGGGVERTDNRSHLFSSVPGKTSSRFSEIPRADLYAARELFSDMSDTEIRNLYKRVTQ